MEKKKILAVDDEQDSLEFIKSILEDDTREVITAHDGNEGISRAKAESPDIIILDVQMPHKNGFETFTELKKDSDLRNIPVVMLTGIGEKLGLKFTDEEMKEYYGEKPEYYLEKPIDPEKLEELVDKLI